MVFKNNLIQIVRLPLFICFVLNLNKIQLFALLYIFFPSIAFNKQKTPKKKQKQKEKQKSQKQNAQKKKSQNKKKKR